LDPKTIRNAMEYIEKEVQPNNKPPDASPEYRKGLAQSLMYKVIIIYVLYTILLLFIPTSKDPFFQTIIILFYFHHGNEQFILSILADKVSPKFKSGSQEIERNLMYGKQDYDTDKSEWPLYQPIPKLEARVQASGFYILNYIFRFLITSSPCQRSSHSRYFLHYSFINFVIFTRGGSVRERHLPRRRRTLRGVSFEYRGKCYIEKYRCIRGSGNATMRIYLIFKMYMNMKYFFHNR